MPIAVGVSAGILLWTASAPWWVALLAVAAGVGLMVVRWHYMSFAFYALAGGWSVAAMHQPSTAPEWVYDGQQRTYAAVVSDLSVSGNVQKMRLRVDSAYVGGAMRGCGSFYVSVAMLPDWSMFVGEKITVTTVIEPPDAYSCFPHDRYSALSNLRQGIAGQAHVDSYRSVGTERSLRWWLHQRRAGIVRLLARSDLSDQSYGMLAALTVGYGDDLDGTIRENFRAAGIAHALALSGFHVGVIIMIVSVGLFPLRFFYRLRRWRLALSIALIWFYAALVGMPDSVVRAVVMLTIVLLAKIMGEESNSANSLCAAVAIILTVSPFSLYSAGFQLSVFAVIGIIGLSGAMNPFDAKRHFAHQAASLVTVPVAAIAGTMIVTAAYFHRLPVLFIVSNVVITFLLPPLMFAGIGVMISVGLGFKAVFLCRVCDWIAGAIDGMCQWLSESDFSEVNGIYLSGWQIGALAVAVAAVIIAANYPRRASFAGAGAAIGAALLAMVLCGERASADEAYIIGQRGSTALLIRLGNNAVAILTCHPRRLENAKEKFERRISAYLESRGVEKMVVTQQDFTFGSNGRRGNVVTVGGKRIALLDRPGRVDTVVGHIDYALICSRFRGTIDEVESQVHPDTILLSSDLSLRRAKALMRGASRPVVDMRRRGVSLQ